MTDPDNDKSAAGDSNYPLPNTDKGSDPLAALPFDVGGEPEVSIDGYVKMREITRGGQAIVFSAIQQSTGRRVAIKLIKDRPFENSIEKSRLDREVRILAALDHPHIVSVIDRGVTRDGFLYFILNYVDGQTLTKYMEEYRRAHKASDILQDPSDVLRLFMRICDAVNAAHLRGIVHRDLKPSNVIVDNHGEPHILDFGLARSSMPLQSTDEDMNPMTMTGQFIGSLQWASPEQAEGIPGKIDTRSDVYALGVMLYQMLTGSFPYDVQATLKEVLDHILLSQPLPPSDFIQKVLQDRSGKKASRVRCDLMKAADAVVLKALAKKREDRYQTAGEMAKDLQRILSGHATEAAKGQAAAPSRRAVLLAAAGGLLLGVAAMMVAWPRSAVPAAHMPAPKAAEPPVGYRVEGDDVVFQFDARLFEVARLPDGRLGMVSNLQGIATVDVAGPFNGWIPGRDGWRMAPIDKNRFELRKPLTAIGPMGDTPFKFVIDGNIWVSAPRLAPNREIVLTDSAAFNLILRNPKLPVALPLQVLDLYRAHINGTWPGFGGNLAMDDHSRFFFTLSGREMPVQELDLAVLDGLPLTGLSLYDITVKDFAPLARMFGLQYLVFSDLTLKTRFSVVYDNLARGEYGLAQKALERVLQPLQEVPAFARFGAIVGEGIATMGTLAKKPGEVPAGAKTYQGHRYALVPVPMTWPEARAYAEKHGAHLVSITSSDEHYWIIETFTQHLLGHSIWIGATDEMIEGKWGWLSTEEWAFSRWSGGEPNNENGGENTIEMKADGWWHDVDGAAFRFPFVMEWDDP